MNAARAIRHAPVMRQMIRIRMVNDSLVGAHDSCGRRIELVRKLVERYEAEPLTIVGSAVVRKTSIASVSDRDAAGGVVTDVAGRVRVGEVLRWTAVATQRRYKLVPITRAIDREECLQIDDVGIKRRPAQRQSHGSSFEDHGTVTRDFDLEADRLVL